MVLRGKAFVIVITNIIPVLIISLKQGAFSSLSLDGAPIPADASMLKFERVVEGNNRALIVKNVTKRIGFLIQSIIIVYFDGNLTFSLEVVTLKKHTVTGY